MGNRAVITTRENFENNGVGVYLHWNGDINSVEAILRYCELKGYRKPTDDCYGWAYLCGVLTNYFGNGLSCGIDTINNLDCDNWDNGVYIIDGWQIMGREFFNGNEKPDYDMLADMIIKLDRRMPTDMQMGMEKMMERLQEIIDNQK